MPSLFVPSAYATKIATISNAAKPITDATFSWTAGHVALADQAVITAYTQAVIATWDGTTPTATTGRQIAVGETLEIRGANNVQNLQFIRAGGSDGAVSITLEKFS